MYIAHSQIEEFEKVSKPAVKQLPATGFKQMSAQEQFEHDMAYKSYLRACKKHAKDIAEIREVFPDYTPEFRWPIK